MRLSASVFLIALVCNLRLAVVHADVVQYKDGESLVHQERRAALDDVTKLEHYQNTPAKVELNKLWKEEEDSGDNCSEDGKDWHYEDDCDGDYEHGDKDRHHCKSKHADSKKKRSKHCWAPSTDTITTVTISTTSISTFYPDTTDGLYASSASLSTVTSSATSSTESTTSSTTTSTTTTTTVTSIPTPTIACTDDTAWFQTCVQEGVTPDWYWCVNGEWVYQACEPSTVCRQGTDRGVYCDFP